MGAYENLSQQRRWKQQFFSLGVILLASVIPIFSLQVLASDVPVAENTATPAAVPNSNVGVLDPTQWLPFLRESNVEIGKPKIFISRYNLNEGLFVGYQSESGKRILFRSQSFLGIGTSGQVLHFDPAQGKVVELVGRSKNTDEKGKRVRDVNVGGIDIRNAMTSIKEKSSKASEKEQQLKQFATSDAGIALLDGVVALYAALDGANDDASTAKLLAPFGSVVLMLQLTSKQYRGFVHADKVLDASKVAALKAACGNDKSCAMRGSNFIVHSAGLFDPLSKFPAQNDKKSN